MLPLGPKILDSLEVMLSVRYIVSKKPKSFHI